MKLRLSMRAALAFGYSDVARFLGRLRRWQRGILSRAGHEAGKGNVVTAIRQRVPAPSPPAIIRLRLNLWRLRRISAGLERARARGDANAVSRWLSRGLKACNDLEDSRLSCKASRRIR